jgi:hypothetical protein
MAAPGVMGRWSQFPASWPDQHVDPAFEVWPLQVVYSWPMVAARWPKELDDAAWSEQQVDPAFEVQAPGSM